MNFLPYIKAVGTGKKRNRDLSKEESYQAMKAMLNGEVAPEQVSAFLLGWRVKGETIDEFQGALEAFDECITEHPIKNSIEFGYPYDGKVKNPYLFPLIAKYLEPHGINLSLHGDELQPAKGGITVKEVCTNVQLNKNIHFFDRAQYFRELHQLNRVRNVLGMRSSFNTLEKLMGISQSETAIIGAFHKPFIDKYIKLFKDRYKKLIIIKGNEGTPEIFSKCSIIIVENDEVTELKVDPKEHGVEYTKSWKAISIEESLEMTKKPSKALEKLAEFNAKVILFLMGITKAI